MIVPSRIKINSVKGNDGLGSRHHQISGHHPSGSGKEPSGKDSENTPKICGSVPGCAPVLDQLQHLPDLTPDQPIFIVKSEGDALVLRQKFGLPVLALGSCLRCARIGDLAGKFFRDNRLILLFKNRRERNLYLRLSEVLAGIVFGVQLADYSDFNLRACH